MTSDNVAIVRQFMAAQGAYDDVAGASHEGMYLPAAVSVGVDGVADMLSDGFECITFPGLPFGREAWKGTDGYRELGEMFDANFVVVVRNLKIYDAGDDDVFLTEDVEYTIKTTGKSVVLPTVDWFRLSQGKIDFISTYYTKIKILYDLWAEGQSLGSDGGV
jgi:ketosteroid isomerase-like protein